MEKQCLKETNVVAPYSLNPDVQDLLVPARTVNVCAEIESRRRSRLSGLKLYCTQVIYFAALSCFQGL